MPNNENIHEDNSNTPQQLPNSISLLPTEGRSAAKVTRVKQQHADSDDKNSDRLFDFNQESPGRKQRHAYLRYFCLLLLMIGIIAFFIKFVLCP